MKIDKRNPRHWLFLLLLAINTLAAIASRPLKKHKRAKHRSKKIILYGHRLSGNLLALYRYISKYKSDEFELTFLTMDPDYFSQLKRDNVAVCHAINSSAIKLLAEADALISDHGLHSMSPLVWLSDIKFFDVWHGIPFKGFDKKDFKTQQRYTEVWVASPLLANLYIEKFGFDERLISVTGYARTDCLAKPAKNRQELQREFGIQDFGYKKTILFAPTWKQDNLRRDVFPFGMDSSKFVDGLLELCEKHDACLIFRAHINVGTVDLRETDRIKSLPFGEFPDTESLLQVSDILICDWSSIAFDYLLLNRPTLFLDVPAPFAKGFSLGKEHRFDQIITDYPALIETLDQTLGEYDRAISAGSTARKKVSALVYESYADGHSASRCMNRLKKHLINNESFQ